jgi:hypothetical protein
LHGWKRCSIACFRTRLVSLWRMTKANSTGLPPMVDSLDQHAANVACEVILDVAFIAASEVMDHTQLLPEAAFNGLVKLEVTASLAIDRLIRAYMVRVFKEAESAVPEGCRATHVLTATVNPFIGAVIALMDGMPPSVRAEFLQTYAQNVEEAIAHYLAKKARQDREAGHA